MGNLNSNRGQGGGRGVTAPQPLQHCQEIACEGRAACKYPNLGAGMCMDNERNFTEFELFSNSPETSKAPSLAVREEKSHHVDLRLVTLVLPFRSPRGSKKLHRAAAFGHLLYSVHATRRINHNQYCLLEPNQMYWRKLD